jgi:hypothetical protein
MTQANRSGLLETRKDMERKVLRRWEEPSGIVYGGRLKMRVSQWGEVK